MGRAPDEGQSWDRKAEQDKAKDPLEELRKELRRRSELARLHRSLSRNYPTHG